MRSIGFISQPAAFVAIVFNSFTVTSILKYFVVMDRKKVNRKWLLVLFHSIGWIVLFSLPFFLRTSYNKAEHKAPRRDDEALFYFYIFSSVLWVGLFYLNANLLLPAYLFAKKQIVFFTSQLAALAVIFGLHWLYFKLFVFEVPFKAMAFFGYNIFTYLFIIAGSTTYAMVNERERSAKLSQEKETENLKTELLFLRSQVSPHFMFNVLNNMVALARKKSDLLEPSLIKLSALMRYMLYETDEQKVPLEKEVEYIESYIDLQRQRFGKNLTVNASFQHIDNWQEIEPMLLIPFVENAFKHGTGIIENPVINICLKEEKEHIFLTVSNKYNHTVHEVKDKDSGIGLNNVKRRLNLLYGKQHILNIKKIDGWFTISLQINLTNA